MRRRLIGSFLLCAVTAAVARGSQSRGASPAQPLVDATYLRLQPEQAESGSTRVFIVGDETKPGVYVYRNTFPPGQTSRPHYHTGDRYVTVIKGTWWTGEGDVYQPDKMVPIHEGGFMFHPAGYHHYDGAKDTPVTVQIIGVGRIETIQTEVDANGKPVPRR
jgi:quercetin dioxygenase-like cupin family protein